MDGGGGVSGNESNRTGGFREGDFISWSGGSSGKEWKSGDDEGG